MPSPSRRSRMQRTRTGKRIELTDRDLEIFRVLVRYRYLSSAYIYAFVGGASETRFKERLGDLFHEGYIDRPERQWEMANCRYRPVIHEIGSGAKRVLEERRIVEEARTWLRPSASRQFLHSLMICEILASIEIGTRVRPGLRFIPWPEVLAKAPAETRASAAPFRFPATTSSREIVPDGLFGLEYLADGTKAYRFFAVEADRGTMPVSRSNGMQTSYLGKLVGYRKILSLEVHKAHLRVPNLLVLTITTSNERLNQIMMQFRELSEGAAMFLFRAIGASELTSPSPRLLLEPWKRADLSPLRIDE